MHQNKLVGAIKANGKILREHGENVYLPFGCEYTVFIKNLNSVRCLVNLEIDGSDIAEGTQFIVPANGFIELERFVKNGNMSGGNRFKFIERTARVEAGRGGIQAEDGFIRVQYEFERLPVPISQWWNTQTAITKGGYNPLYGASTGGQDFLNTRIGSASGSVMPSSNATFRNETYSDNDGTMYRSATSTGSTMRGVKMKGISANASLQSSVSDFATAQGANTMPKADLNVAGVTVAGSVSSQQFTQGGYVPTDGVKHVMVLKLLGEVGQVEVVAPLTVKTKQKCTTCHHVNKSSAKFCSECGTGLLIV